MLKHWQSHQEYLHFLHEAKVHFDSSQRKRLSSEFASARDKLRLLDLDPVMVHLAPFYSTTGRPALNQPQIIRSLTLMLHLGVTSLTRWLNRLASDDLLAFLIGCSPSSLPPLGSYFDFIDRLWLQNPAFERLGRKDLFPAHKNLKPSKKPSKGEKLPNRHSGITEIVATQAVSRNEFPFHYEKLLQELFRLTALLPSLHAGLIPSDGLVLSGDGTCVHTHSFPYGHKVCSCSENGIRVCSCPRHYSDPDAAWGWDSDLNCFYFGHTLYMLSSHNDRYCVDLPLHFHFFDARRHDSVSGIVSLKEFRDLNPDIPVRDLCLDSAHDNYPTYQLCKTWEIRPFIDLNSKSGRPKSIPDSIRIDPDGTPVCQAGYRMVYWGFCSKRSRCKWRCPVACKKVKNCSCRDSCSSSPYGRCIYTKPEWDIRLYTPVPRGTTEYKNIYKNRTSCERVNDRVLNDYQLHNMKIHTKKRYSFFLWLIGTNIHLDAQLKKLRLQATA